MISPAARDRLVQFSVSQSARKTIARKKFATGCAAPVAVGAIKKHPSR